MRHLLIALALLFLTGGAAQASNLPFLHGNSDNHELAQKIRASLAKDPSGNSILDPARCAKDGSCASPRSYFESYQHDKPDLTLETTAAYIDSFLEIVPTAAQYEVRYDMDCLQPVGNGQYRTVINCLPRRLKSGEKMYVDPVTKHLRLAQDCSNPIRGVHKEEVEPIVAMALPPPCVTIAVTVINRPGYGLPKGERMAILGAKLSQASIDRCLALKRPSDADFVKGWPQECPMDTCNFQGATQHWRQPLERVGSYVPREAGVYVVRLPPEVAKEPYVVVFCEELVSATGRVYHSDTYGVREKDYRNRHVDLPREFVYRTNPLP